MYYERKNCRTYFKNIEGVDASDIIASIEIPPRPDMGDYAFPCFRLAKVMRKAPNMIAADIKEQIGDVDFIEKLMLLAHISTSI